MLNLQCMCLVFWRRTIPHGHPAHIRTFTFGTFNNYCKLFSINFLPRFSSLICQTLCTDESSLVGNHWSLLLQPSSDKAPCASRNRVFGERSLVQTYALFLQQKDSNNSFSVVFFTSLYLSIFIVEWTEMLKLKIFGRNCL